MAGYPVRTFGALLVAVGLSGCASWPIAPSTEAIRRSPVSSAPPKSSVSLMPHRSGTSSQLVTVLESADENLVARTRSASAKIPSDWSSQSRAGRDAVAAGDYPAAEAFLFSALRAAAEFRSSDVRIDASVGNLVRLAARYQEDGHGDKSKHLLLEIQKAAARLKISQRRIDVQQTRYANSTTRLESLRSARKSVETKRRGRRHTGHGPSSFDHLIQHAATSYDVDPALIKAVVAAESNFEPRAVSRVGAQGLMQLMPETARAMGVRRPFVPRENIRGGVRYLRSLMDRFDDLDHALAAYNAGPDAVLRYGGVPPYPETEDYVAKVRNHYRLYKSNSTQ